TLSPLLFRDVLGRTRTFLFSALLSFSPVLLLASRSSSPAVWSTLFAVLGLWAIWRWRTTTENRDHYAILATTFAAALALLSEPGGLVLAIVLAVAIIGTATMMPHEGETADSPLAELREHLRPWPWTTALAVAGGAVVLISTGFMLFQPGLSAV